MDDQADQQEILYPTRHPSESLVSLAGGDFETIVIRIDSGEPVLVLRREKLRRERLGQKEVLLCERGEGVSESRYFVVVAEEGLPPFGRDFDTEEEAEIEYRLAKGPTGEPEPS